LEGLKFAGLSGLTEDRVRVEPTSASIEALPRGKTHKFTISLIPKRHISISENFTGEEKPSTFQF